MFTGIVSNFGQEPVVGKVLNTYLVTGPMSRFCADLIPMYRVLAADNVKKLKLDSKVIYLYSDKRLKKKSKKINLFHFHWIDIIHIII